MLAKIFEYTDISNNSALYLNGPDSANPEKMLELYVKWHNEEYAPFEKLPPVDYNNFKFISSYAPIDFYDDYYKSYRFQDMKNV